MKNLFLLFSVTVILLATSIVCSAAGPWRGKVIDAETKRPIGGAVVVAVWHKVKDLPLGPYTSNIDAIETVTDKDGNFEIPATSFLYIPFLREIKGPYFTIFKPSYGYFPRYAKLKEPHPVTPFEGISTVVEMTKWKTAEERKQNLLSGDIIGIPRKKYNLLIKAINEESRAIGLPTYPEEK